METPNGVRQNLSLQQAAEAWNCQKVIEYLRGGDVSLDGLKIN